MTEREELDEAKANILACDTVLNNFKRHLLKEHKKESVNTFDVLEQLELALSELWD